MHYIKFKFHYILDFFGHRNSRYSLYYSTILFAISLSFTILFRSKRHSLVRFLEILQKFPFFLLPSMFEYLLFESSRVRVLLARRKWYSSIFQVEYFSSSRVEYSSILILVAALLSNKITITNLDIAIYNLVITNPKLWKTSFYPFSSLFEIFCFECEKTGEIIKTPSV